MKKILLSLFIISASTVTCFAQQIESFSLGGEFGLPQDQASKLYNYTMGISVKLELPTYVKSLKFIAQLAYTDYVIKPSIRKSSDLEFLPIEVGAKLYIHKFYLEGDVGESTNLNSSYKGKRVALICAPGIGYAIPVLISDEIDFGLKYEVRIQTGDDLIQPVLRVAYKFNL